MRDRLLYKVPQMSKISHFQQLWDYWDCERRNGQKGENDDDDGDDDDGPLAIGVNEGRRHRWLSYVSDNRPGGEKYPGGRYNRGEG